MYVLEQSPSQVEPKWKLGTKKILSPGGRGEGGAEEGHDIRRWKQDDQSKEEWVVYGSAVEGNGTIMEGKRLAMTCLVMRVRVTRPHSQDLGCWGSARGLELTNALQLTYTGFDEGRARGGPTNATDGNAWTASVDGLGWTRVH